MGSFDDLRLNWKGVDFTIKGNRRLGAIARVEEFITLPRLASYLGARDVPYGKLSQAYAAVLRYAGASVDDEDVFDGMFDQGLAPTDQVATAIAFLIQLMTPKRASVEDGAGETNPPMPISTED